MTARAREGCSENDVDEDDKYEGKREKVEEEGEGEGDQYSGSVLNLLVSATSTSAEEREEKSEMKAVGGVVEEKVESEERKKKRHVCDEDKMDRHDEDVDKASSSSASQTDKEREVCPLEKPFKHIVSLFLHYYTYSRHFLESSLFESSLLSCATSTLSTPSSSSSSSCNISSKSNPAHSPPCPTMLSSSSPLSFQEAFNVFLKGFWERVVSNLPHVNNSYKGNQGDTKTHQEGDNHKSESLSQMLKSWAQGERSLREYCLSIHCNRFGSHDDVVDWEARREWRSTLLRMMMLVQRWMGQVTGKSLLRSTNSDSHSDDIHLSPNHNASTPATPIAGPSTIHIVSPTLLVHSSFQHFMEAGLCQFAPLALLEKMLVVKVVKNLHSWKHQEVLYDWEAERGDDGGQSGIILYRSTGYDPLRRQDDTGNSTTMLSSSTSTLYALPHALESLYPTAHEFDPSTLSHTNIFATMYTSTTSRNLSSSQTQTERFNSLKVNRSSFHDINEERVQSEYNGHSRRENDDKMAAANKRVGATGRSDIEEKGEVDNKRKRKKGRHKERTDRKEDERERKKSREQERKRKDQEDGKRKKHRDEKAVEEEEKKDNDDEEEEEKLLEKSLGNKHKKKKKKKKIFENRFNWRDIVKLSEYGAGWSVSDCFPHWAVKCAPTLGETVLLMEVDI